MSAVVLIVEDERLLRIQAGIAGRRRLCGVAGGECRRAIAILESRADIRGVFTDIPMPGSMDGLKMAFAIRNRWPPVPIIVTSGQVRPERGMLPDNVSFLGKPYEGLELTSLLGTLAA